MKPHLNIQVNPTDYRFGDGKLKAKLRGITSPDWTSHFDFFIWQLVSDGDTDDCWAFGGTKAVDACMDALIASGAIPDAVVQQIIAMGFMDMGIDGKQHFHSSERFAGVLSGLGQNGGSVQTALDISKKYGCVPFTKLPVSRTMTLEQYFDKTAITPDLMALGKQFRDLMGGKDFILYQWANDGGKTDINKLAQAIAGGPLVLGIPVNDGWNQVHPTIATGPAVHVVDAVSVPNPAVNITDNYAPFMKVLDAGYEIPYALQVIVQYLPPPPVPTLPPNPTTQQEVSWLDQIKSWLLNLLERLQGGERLQGASRSPHWPAVEKAFRKLNPLCKVCDTKNNLNVHHIQPFHLDPAKELDPQNLITLCRPHHLLFGHFMNWSSFNSDVRSDATLWKSKVENRP